MDSWLDDFGKPDKSQRNEQQEQSALELSKQKLKPGSPNQPKYFKAIETSTVTICTGPCGTGKTFVACGIAAQMLREQRIDKIILTRPLITCGKGFGFLPGDLDQKVSPYMIPLLDALEEFLGLGYMERCLRDGYIEITPLDLMRGRSIKHAFIICDEAQNATFEQLHMLATRLDKNTRLVITGDASQTDLPHKGPNPLSEVIERFTPQCHPDISIVRLTHDDIMRPGIVRWIDERLTSFS